MKTLGYWLLLDLLRLLSLMPYKLIARAGCILSATLYRLPSHRKHLVLVNLRLCSPMKTECQRENLALARFRHVVRCYLERGFQWFGSARMIDRLVRMDSATELDDRAAHPAIFMGVHFVGIEVDCVRYSSRLPVVAIYTWMSNARVCVSSQRAEGGGLDRT